jgi:hypothetical protein
MIIDTDRKGTLLAHCGGMDGHLHGALTAGGVPCMGRCGQRALVCSTRSLSAHLYRLWTMTLTSDVHGLVIEEYRLVDRPPRRTEGTTSSTSSDTNSSTQRRAEGKTLGYVMNALYEHPKPLSA